MVYLITDYLQSFQESLLGQDSSSASSHSQDYSGTRQGLMDPMARREGERLTVTSMMEAGISTVRNSARIEEDEEHVTTSKEKKKMNEKKRVVMKGGSTSVTYKNISKKRRRYFSDLYTTLLDSSWSYCVLMFMASFYDVHGKFLFLVAPLRDYLLCDQLPPWRLL